MGDEKQIPTFSWIYKGKNQAIQNDMVYAQPSPKS